MLSTVKDCFDVELLPSLAPLAGLDLQFVADSSGASCTDDTGCAVAYLVAEDDEPPADGGWTWEALGRFGFTGALGETMVFPAVDQAPNVLVGLGDPSEAGPDQFREAGAAVARKIGKRTSLCINVEGRGTLADIQALVEGALLARYQYVPFKTDLAKVPPFLTDLTVVGGSGISAQLGESALRRARSFARSAFIARDLVNCPPAHLNPETLAQVAVDLASRFGFQAQVLELEELEEMGCGGLVGVNRGSSYPARMVHVKYAPADTRPGSAPLTFVGKGITFDSGGLSLKGANIMLDMKTDMGGAAAILGAFSSLAALDVDWPVEGWLAITDNMVSGNSLRVGEVLTARNGKTVEINNTDAEGRLVLMDALSLAVEDSPAAIVDIATLTGAQVVALGEEVAAVMGNDADLVDAVEESALATGEDVWELPLPQRYLKIMKSNIADLANANMSTRAAGSITAGLFLSQFVGETPWAHIDIAGPASAKASDRWVCAGATGFGARLLLDLAANFVSDGGEDDPEG